MYGLYNEAKIVVIVIFGAFLNAISLDLFLIPAHVYASGFTGIAQLASELFRHTPIPLSTGILLFIFNIPVAYLGWKRVGNRFALYSFFSVV
ncbi:MAG TPA: YitT family protein, partial [Bacillales bacterium]|nr:YitT family protein [Bacillales bacterium]